MAASPAQQKVLGAYYTDEAVATFIAGWALRSRSDSALDPSCGDGVFLSAAFQRLRRLGNQTGQILGVDIDRVALRAARLREPASQLLEQDFFSLKPGDIPPVTAIIGNPPFIRYQTFNGSSRSNALSRTREVGVELPQLSSSWAPFLVHAAGFLKKGGRLGMVAPAELAHAQYARQVLLFVFRVFGRVTIRAFHEKLFPDLSQDTFLLLCEDYGKECDWCSVVPAVNLAEIGTKETHGLPIDIKAIQSGSRRLTHYLLPPKARHLYEAMTETKGVARLGSAADVGIGYVTGANDFFHLTHSESRAWRIPSRYLRKAILSLADFEGTALRADDWKRSLLLGQKVYLLALPESIGKKLPKDVSRYLSEGIARNIPARFKCRVRKTWYVVPHVRLGEALLAYMSGPSPKLIANTANLVAPNTLHVLRFKKGWKVNHLAAGWYSSLTRLSCELEGHPLGGGMLKLEPSEAENVLIALPYRNDTPKLFNELDVLLRSGLTSEAMDIADSRILRRRFGLSASECLTLRESARYLEVWRMHR
ncbi:MAG TPA: N-6 DNA methylase [Candidatus Acidoferrales bacterium]|nr:N-6 DNA methylase [Candidatus Acidoferrales bacterium]